MIGMWQGKRYHSFNSYLKRRFGRRVWKVTVDAGMTCPNRDGSVGDGGCSYCLRDAHSGGAPGRPVVEQIAEGIKSLRRRRKAERFIVYFQAGTNTYAPIYKLKSLFDTVKAFSEVVGLAVGTRPDCLGDPVLDLLESYASDYEVWLELGLQSAHDNTLASIDRGHGLQSFLDAYNRARERPLKLCVHLILGLPGEGADDMLETGRQVAGLRPDGLKLHPLQVLRGTTLAEQYKAGKFRLLSLEEYVSVVCDSLEILPSETTIQRLTAEAPASLLLAPDWCRNKQALLAAIDNELVRRGTFQGSLFSPPVT